jgi:putative ABC transport system permease protein
MFDIFQHLFTAGLVQGLILSLIALGAMIPFRILNLPDLTPEGTFPLGGALCAALLLSGMHPILATLCAILAGGLVGMGTAQIYLRFKVNTLLAGIILSAMLYSVNLRLMGKPNLALFEVPTLFTMFNEETVFVKILSLFILNVVCALAFIWFLGTEKGLRLRAVGLNTNFAEKQGVRLSFYVSLGLFLGNGLASFAGALMVQNQKYADVSMGVGIVIHALAAIMIGESLLQARSLKGQVLAPLLGALVYQQIQGIAISLGLAPSDLKLVTGAIVLCTLAYRQWQKK